MFCQTLSNVSNAALLMLEKVRTQCNHFGTTLPESMLTIICSFLPTRTISSLQRVCTNWFRIANKNKRKKPNSMTLIQSLPLPCVAHYLTAIENRVWTIQKDGEWREWDIEGPEPHFKTWRVNDSFTKIAGNERVICACKETLVEVSTKGNLNLNTITTWEIWRDVRLRTMGTNQIQGVALYKNDVYLTTQDWFLQYSLEGRLIHKWSLPFVYGGGAGFTIYQDEIFMINAEATHRDANCLQVYSMKGKLLREFGKGGRGKGQLYYPRGIHVANDIVYVTDPHNCRIQVFYVSGTFLFSHQSKERQWWTDLCVAQNCLCVLDSGNGMHVLTRSNQLPKQS